MPRRTTFTLEEDEFIREARNTAKPATWVAIGLELNRPAETCRLHWTNVVSRKPSYKDALALRKQGMTATETARKLKMNPQTVMWWYRRASEKDIERPNYQTRTCLKCRDPFASEGKHHRICPTCKNSASWHDGDIAQPYSFGAR